MNVAQGAKGNGLAAVVDAWASEPHYRAHVAPVFEALPHPGVWSAQGASPVIVGSFFDLQMVRPRRTILMEHGAGQTYDRPQSSYAGGPGRGHVVLFLCPSEHVAAVNRAAYPDVAAVAVGCPKLDRWHGLARTSDVVAVAFHWRATIAREAGTAFSAYRDAVVRMARTRTVIGHGHPRAWRYLEPFYRQAGIEPVADADEVVRRAGVLVADNTSLGWEWAALDRPLVWLNDPTWRRTYSAWPRFWHHADAGEQVWRPDELETAVDEALRERPERVSLRRAAAREIYGEQDGRATERAVAAIVREVGP